METTEVIQQIVQLLDKLGTIGILVFWIMSERKERRDLQNEIMSDWKRQNDREQDKQSS